jgi:general secretion pathway protein N
MTRTMPSVVAPRRGLSTHSPHSPVAPWRWAVLGAVVGTLVAVLLFAPAQWLARGVAQATQGRVQLRAAQGTVWTGSAQLVLGAGSGSDALTALPSRVHWRLRPGASGASLALAAPCCLSHDWLWKLAPTLQGVVMTPADLTAAQPSRWPSSLLSGLGTPWNTLQLEGTLALSAQQMRLELANGQWQLQGSAQLDAQRMTTSLSTLKPMGSYRMRWQGGAAPTLTLSTLDGSLQLSGQGSWANGRLHFDGEASAAPERAEALANLLNIIGRRDGARSIIKVG